MLEPCQPGGRRRTAFTTVLARQGMVWVSLVPALANRILAAALEDGDVPGLEGAVVVGREVRRGHSRFDFEIAQAGRVVLTEVKSATLVEDGLALFPDAPTARGARHLQELTAHRRQGGHSLLVFVVQRPDAVALAPHRAIDPLFAARLSEAVRAGVRVLAYRCRVSPRGCSLAEPIPVRLEPA